MDWSRHVQEDDGRQQQDPPLPPTNVRTSESADLDNAAQQQADVIVHVAEDPAPADKEAAEAATWRGDAEPSAGEPVPTRAAENAPITDEQKALFERWQEAARKERRRKAATEAARRRREASKSTGTTGSSTSLNQPQQQQHRGRGKKAKEAVGKVKRSDLIKLLQAAAGHKRRHPSPGKGGAKRKHPEAGEHGEDEELDWKDLGFGPDDLVALEAAADEEEEEESDDPDDDEVVELGEDEQDYRRRREQRANRGRFVVQEALQRRAELLKQPRHGVFIHMCRECKERQKKAEQFLWATTNAQNMSMLCIELCGECLEKNIQLAVSYGRQWVDNKVALPPHLANPLHIERGAESTGSDDNRLLSFKFGWMLHQCAACLAYQKALAKDIFVQKKADNVFELTFMVCSVCCLANRDLQTSINRKFSGFADQRK